MASKLEEAKAAAAAVSSTKTGESREDGLARIKAQYPHLTERERERLWSVESGAQVDLSVARAQSRAADAALANDATAKLLKAAKEAEAAKQGAKKAKPPAKQGGD